MNLRSSEQYSREILEDEGGDVSVVYQASRAGPTSPYMNGEGGSAEQTTQWGK